MSMPWLERLRWVLSIARARLLGQVHVERAGQGGASTGQRILYVANSNLPTLQLSFVEPLRQEVESGRFSTELLSEIQMRMLFGKRVHDGRVLAWVRDRLQKFDPQLLVFCRYSGPHAEFMMAWARERNVPTLFHIDDDLLQVPTELGAEKYSYHSDPARQSVVRLLLRGADLVYCSTDALRQRLLVQEPNVPSIAGAIYCSGEARREPGEQAAIKIGYMGFGHAHDLAQVLPAIENILRRYPHVEFELFGTISKPKSLQAFGRRVRQIPPVANYAHYLEKLSALGWDIGICPLAPTTFNAVKANTKWVEYTMVGTAVIASKGTIYDDCCRDDCGILAHGEEEWGRALESLVLNGDLKAALVKNAQRRLRDEYSPVRLRQQVLGMFDLARDNAGREANLQLQTRAIV